MAFTDSAAYDSLVTATHHTLPFYDLRPELIYEACVSVDSTPSTHRGSSHNWNFFNDMAVQDTPLSETTDVTPVALADATRTVTIDEYGAAIETSGFLRGTSYMEVNPIVWEIIGYNAGLSVDTIYRNRLESASSTTDGGVANVVFSDAGAPDLTGPQNSLTAGDIFSANIIRFVTAELRGDNVRPFGATYKGIIHPDVAYDLYSAAPNNNWADPHIHVDPSGIYLNVVGTFGGVMWMESPRASLFADAGAGNFDVYGTYVLGVEAFGKMTSSADDYGDQPQFVQRQPIDYLARFRSAGWKHLLGSAVFRTAPIWRIETISSKGANA